MIKLNLKFKKGSFIQGVAFFYFRIQTNNRKPCINLYDEEIHRKQNTLI